MSSENSSNLLLNHGRPNIVLLVIDAARADHFSTYGYYRPTTPTIDRLAREGLVYENAYTIDTASPLAHFALLSGQEDWSGRAWLQRAGLGRRVEFLARRVARRLKLTDYVGGYDHSRHSLLALLRQQGYYTAGASANLLVSPKTLQPYDGFDEFAENRLLEGLATDSQIPARLAHYGVADTSPNRQAVYFTAERIFSLADAAASAAHARNQPFFVFMNVLDCHDPYLPHPDQQESFGFVSQSDFNGDLRNRPAALRAQAEGVLHAWTHTHDLRPAEIDLLRWNYDRCLNYVDQQLDQFIQQLEARQQAEDTVFIVLADHGELLGERGRIGHSLEPSPEQMRIPLVVSGRRYIQSGLRIEAPVRIVDVRPSLIELLNAKDPFVHCSGQSLFAPARRRMAVAATAHNTDRQAALMGGQRAQVSNAELEVMEERLRNLGYLD